MENQDIQFTFDKKPVLSQSQQDSLNIKLKHIILLEQELGFVVPVLYTKPKDGTLFNLKQYVEDVNSRKGISKPEDYSAISMFLDNNIIHLESMKNQKESKQEVPVQPVECPEKEEIKFTFSCDKRETSTLNELLKEIIHIEETVLGWDELKLFTDVSGNTPIDLKSYVELNDYVLGEHHCRAIHRRLTRTLNKLKELGDESLKEQVVPEKEETSLKPWEQEELEHVNRITQEYLKHFESSRVATEAIQSLINVVIKADSISKQYGLGLITVSFNEGEVMTLEQYFDSRKPIEGWRQEKLASYAREVLKSAEYFKTEAEKIISDFEAEIKANSDWCK